MLPAFWPHDLKEEILSFRTFNFYVLLYKGIILYRIIICDSSIFREITKKHLLEVYQSTKSTVESF